MIHSNAGPFFTNDIEGPRRWQSLQIYVYLSSARTHASFGISSINCKFLVSSTCRKRRFTLMRVNIFRIFPLSRSPISISVTAITGR